MQYAIVTIRLSELHTQRLEMPPWEIPVAAAVHGDADVQVVDQVDVDRHPPDALEEFGRLERRYGVDPKSEIPYVAQVYGQHQPGISRLAQAIAEAAPARTGQARAKGGSKVRAAG